MFSNLSRKIWRAASVSSIDYRGFHPQDVIDSAVWFSPSVAVTGVRNLSHAKLPIKEKPQPFKAKPQAAPTFLPALSVSLKPDPPRYVFESWSPAQVKKWASQYITRGSAQLVQCNGNTLEFVNKAHLDEMGVPKEEAKILLKAIRALARRHKKRDPALILKSLPDVSDYVNEPVRGPLTSVYFPFQKKERMPTVRKMWDRVIGPNWKAFKLSTEDKKSWWISVIHGFSGVGKTRFCLELLSLLEELLRSEYLADTNAQEFLKHLHGGHRTFLLDVKTNGHKMTAKEALWPASTILGVRVAAQFWLPQVPYADTRAMLMGTTNLHEAFELRNVLSWIAKELPCSSPGMLPVIHIAVDEIQTEFGRLVPYQGAGLDTASEPLARALNRALVAAITTTRNAIVIGSFAGVASFDPSLKLHATDHSCLPFLLPSVSEDSAEAIVKSFTFPNGITGHDWLKKKGIKQIIPASGGNCRVLQAMESVLRRYDNVPEVVPVDLLLKAIVDEVTVFYNLDSWGDRGMGILGLMLAVVGIPVTRELNVSFEVSKPVTIADLEKAGIINLRECPEYAVEGSPLKRSAVWNEQWLIDTSKTFVIEVPLLMALSALRQQTGTHKFVISERLLLDFYHSASSFEELIIQHHSYRFYVASILANKFNRSVSAQDLFCGTLCDSALTKLEFLPFDVPMSPLLATKGIWCGPPELEGKVPLAANIVLRDDTTINTKRDNFIVYLGGSNAFDGIQGLLLSSRKRAVIVIDTKFSELLAESFGFGRDVKPLLLKRTQLAKLLPDTLVLLVVGTNKLAVQRSQQPHTAMTFLKGDTSTYIISNTEEGLYWSLSPMVAPLVINT